ncbi:MAG: IS200/IS605 family transposase, partial [Leptospirales bacterium]
KTLAPELLDCLHDPFGLILADWRCTLLEFGGEADHVHLLVEIHPALNISTLINNLKTASARRVRNRFPDHLKPFYSKPYFWHRAYYVGSVAGATLETGPSLCRKPRDQGKTAQGQTARLTPSWLQPK